MPRARFYNPYFKRDQSEQTRQRVDYFSLVGCICLVVLLLWFIFGYWNVLSAKNVAVGGEQYLTVDQVTTATQQALQQRRWLLLRQSFLPVMDTQKLADDIRTNLAATLQLESVVVDKQWPNGVKVTITERVPGYVYINGKDYYYLDVQGVITKQTTEAEADPHFPHLRERNKKREVVVGQLIIQPDVLAVVSELHDDFTPVTNLDISEYAILPVTCQEKQYVTEKIFADEIAGSKTDSIKEQKRAILDQLRNGTITVDQSLDRLQQIKHAETGEDGGNGALLKWDTEYVNTQCDYATVIRDIAIVTQQGPDVYMDTGIELTTQLDNLVAVLSDELEDLSDVGYIDVRFTDRVYYQ